VPLLYLASYSKELVVWVEEQEGLQEMLRRNHVYFALVAAAAEEEEAEEHVQRRFVSFESVVVLLPLSPNRHIDRRLGALLPHTLVSYSFCCFEWKAQLLEQQVEAVTGRISLAS
jgi:hypothetical protein